MTDPASQRPVLRRRSWLDVRWRQFRNAPRPVVRAVISSLSVATVLGLAYLAYDVAISRGAQLPGGDVEPGASADGNHANSKSALLLAFLDRLSH